MPEALDVSGEVGLTFLAIFDTKTTSVSLNLLYFGADDQFPYYFNTSKQY